MDERFGEERVGKIALAVLGKLAASPEGATVLALTGDLGAGKTTLAQAIARELGVQAPVQSPTFVISKYYDTADGRFDRLVHVDAYRIEEESELAPLRWDELLRLPRTLIVVEWPERIKGALPPTAHWYRLAHDEGERSISYVSHP